MYRNLFPDTSATSVTTWWALRSSDERRFSGTSPVHSRPSSASRYDVIGRAQPEQHADLAAALDGVAFDPTHRICR